MAGPRRRAEAVSLLGEVVFRGVFGSSGNRVGGRASYQITMAGTAATKVIATAGAGGIALSVWALAGFGLSGTEVADGMVCLEILLYGVYMGAMAIAGFGLWFGLFAGRAPRETASRTLSDPGYELGRAVTHFE